MSLRCFLRIKGTAAAYRSQAPKSNKWDFASLMRTFYQKIKKVHLQLNPAGKRNDDLRQKQVMFYEIFGTKMYLQINKSHIVLIILTIEKYEIYCLVSLDFDK